MNASGCGENSAGTARSFICPCAARPRAPAWPVCPPNDAARAAPASSAPVWAWVPSAAKKARQTMVRIRVIAVMLNQPRLKRNRPGHAARPEENSIRRIAVSLGGNACRQSPAPKARHQSSGTSRVQEFLGGAPPPEDCRSKNRRARQTVGVQRPVQFVHR